MSIENLTESNHILNKLEDLAIENSITKDLYENQTVGELEPLFSDSFNYNINDLKYKITGSTAVANSQAYVATTAVAGTSASITSRARLIFQPGFSTLVRFDARFTTPVAGGSVQLIGLSNDGQFDALAFGYENLDFGIFHIYNGIPTFIKWFKFNKSKIIPNLTYLNNFQIQMTTGHVQFYINKVLVHEIDIYNSSFTNIVSVVNLPFRLYVSNGTSATDLKIHCSQYGVMTVGKGKIFNIINNKYNSIVSSTTSQNVFNIRVVATYGGKTNYRQAFPKLLNIAGIGASNKFILFRLILNPTLVGAVYNSTRTATTTITEWDTVGVYTPGTGTILYTSVLFSSGTQIIDGSEFELALEAGDVLMCSSSTTIGAGDSAVSLTWTENI